MTANIGTSIAADRPASAEADRQWATWNDCILCWLDALEARTKRRETRRAYAHDMADFFLAHQAADLKPWQVTRLHVLGWATDMRRRRLADATINRRLAALSSLYRFAGEEYLYEENGQERPLWPGANPFAGRTLRTAIEPYARAAYMTTAEVQSLLAQIDAAQPSGLRNLCLIFGLFATMRRVSEWAALRWEDIHEEPDGAWFAYRCKGGKTERQALPASLWDLLRRYRDLPGRQPASVYVFTALSDAAQHLPRIAADYDPGARPLSASYVNRLIRRYGAPVGIVSERLHAHALRHAGARFRKEHGSNIEQVGALLGHTRISTTQIYFVHALTAPHDDFGATVAEVLPPPLRQPGSNRAAPLVR